jgi:hypothetical protein
VVGILFNVAESSGFPRSIFVPLIFPGRPTRFFYINLLESMIYNAVQPKM